MNGIKATTTLGKIKKIDLCHGGYQDAMIGISIDFSMDGGSSGVGTFMGSWMGKRSEYAKWTEQDRINELGKIMLKMDALMTEAKVDYLQALVGKPVEITLISNTFQSFRILTEVL